MAQKKGWLGRLFKGEEKESKESKSTPEDSSSSPSPTKIPQNSPNETLTKTNNTNNEELGTDPTLKKETIKTIKPSKPIDNGDVDENSGEEPSKGSGKEQGKGLGKHREDTQRGGFFNRLKKQLSKTGAGITGGVSDLFLGKKTIDDDILEELETRLLIADVGINTTNKILEALREEVSRKALANQAELFSALREKMIHILLPVEKPLEIPTQTTPYVLLMVGVNGVGKTTTIGKLAKKFEAHGKSVMLAAGDTFRAAAVEQLQIWGKRNQIPVIAHENGGDPASVIFDAIESAKARGIEVLIADTAGRLHTDQNLMNELKKIYRVSQRLDENAPHEVMLVVDAGTGQNALNQAKQFNEHIPLSGISITKLDGTAKGGIIFAIADTLGIPVRYIGVGEGIDDLREFRAHEFVDALLGEWADR